MKQFTLSNKIGSKLESFFSSIYDKLLELRLKFIASSSKTKASFFVMGLGQILYKQYIKGILYLLSEIGFILFFVLKGGELIYGFFTLGLKEADPWLGIKGDNSVIMMILGIFSFLVLIFWIYLYVSNIKDVFNINRMVDEGKEIPSFKTSVKEYVDKKFYKITLALPIMFVLVFNIIPIIFMICIAFTNYGGEIVPPKLVDWTGFASFEKVFSLNGILPTLTKILGWNILWAFSSTFLNYFLGLGLALLLNKKIVKGKAIWRSFPILAYAIPGFITLCGFKFMFSNGGPINQIITANGGSVIQFLGMDSKWIARLIGLLVNAWLNIPTTMLLATGILSNMNTSCYEAAKIDGASLAKQFKDLTLPFVVFATTPTLISQFVSNFNNFGVFYFLRGGLYMDGYFNASDTDLLINWLYNLSIANNYYSIGAAISLIIFIITGGISLIVYVRSNAYKKEDTYR